MTLIIKPPLYHASRITHHFILMHSAAVLRSCAVALAAVLVSCQSAPSTVASPTIGTRELYRARPNVAHVDPPSDPSAPRWKSRPHPKAPEDTMLGKALYPIATGLQAVGYAALSPAIAWGMLLDQN